MLKLSNLLNQGFKEYPVTSIWFDTPVYPIPGCSFHINAYSDRNYFTLSGVDDTIITAKIPLWSRLVA